MVVTVTASLKVALAVTTSPAFKKLFCAPVALLKTTLLTVGAVVSSTGLTVEPGADGWVWFTLGFNVQITLDIS